MEKLLVHGGRSLRGSVRVQGSKNTCLPVMAASLLNAGISVLENCPDIADVAVMQEILTYLGCVVNREGSTLIIDSRDACSRKIDDTMSCRLRASSVLMGPMLSRFGSVTAAKPGGCDIGARPVDIHLEAFKRMGASWSIGDSCIEVSAVNLHEGDIYLKFPSVGATENAVMAAVLTRGKTVIENAAREPEIEHLCRYLKMSGAKISGEGTNKITVEGVDSLSDVVYTVPPDRIVMGTYMAAAAVTRGDIELVGCCASDAYGFFDVYTGMGMKYKNTDKGIRVWQTDRPRNLNCIKTGVYPEFPTDMQSVTLSVAAVGEGCTLFEENIFENRYKIVKPLNDMGADISVHGKTAVVRGVDKLHGCAIKGTDLRGAAALFVAALGAEGDSGISNPFYIYRGYEQLIRNYRELGAEIEEI